MIEYSKICLFEEKKWDIHHLDEEKTDFLLDCFQEKYFVVEKKVVPK